jgi:hypothetical protein
MHTRKKNGEGLQEDAAREIYSEAKYKGVRDRLTGAVKASARTKQHDLEKFNVISHGLFPSSHAGSSGVMVIIAMVVVVKGNSRA